MSGWVSIYSILAQIIYGIRESPLGTPLAYLIATEGLQVCTATGGQCNILFLYGVPGMWPTQARYTSRQLRGRLQERTRSTGCTAVHSSKGDMYI